MVKLRVSFTNHEQRLVLSDLLFLASDAQFICVELVMIKLYRIGLASLQRSLEAANASFHCLQAVLVGQYCEVTQ